MLDALSEHHLVEDLTTLHADKRVVHLRLAEGRKRLHILELVGVGAVEGRAGHSSLRRRGCCCALISLCCLDNILLCWLSWDLRGFPVWRSSCHRGRSGEAASTREQLERPLGCVCLHHHTGRNGQSIDQSISSMCNLRSETKGRAVL